MKFGQIFNYKLILGFSNFALSACGLALLIGGFGLFTDPNQILISRIIGASSETLSNLQHPLFYYIGGFGIFFWPKLNFNVFSYAALGLFAAGLIAIFASLIGWWTTCLNNYCVLSIYFSLVLSMFIAECSFSMAAVWPHCIGLSLDESQLVKVLQSSYGVPGREQLTVSIDLVQTHFKCCAINSNLNYDMSLWKLQIYGQRDWVVPATCCILQNNEEKRSYLDPKPLNITLCQSLLKHEYNRARHNDSCLEHLSAWWIYNIRIFFIFLLVIAIVELMVLVSIIFSCTKMASRTKTSTSSTQTNVLRNNPKRRLAPQPNCQENIYVTSSKLPSAYSYHVSNSYLV